MTLQEQFESAKSLHQAGRLAEAEAIYRDVLAQQPEHADALHLLGVLSARLNRPQAAVEFIQLAIAANPANPVYHCNLGKSLVDCGRLDEAIASYRYAIRIKPDYVNAHFNLGNAFQTSGKFDQATESFRHAIRHKPDFPEAHYNLAVALQADGQVPEAIACYQHAIHLKPSLIEAHFNLGVLLQAHDRIDEAIASYRRVLALDSNHAEAHYNLGIALHNNVRLEESIASYRRAISLKPKFADAHHNLSLALLTKGDFQEGWEEYEWRWECRDVPFPRKFSQPCWDGSPLQNRTILLHTEQGFGDAIQFIRYLPLVAQRGGKIILECQPELQRLFQTIAGQSQVVVRAQPLPEFDVHCPLLSLPRIFQTNLGNIPRDVPYLRAIPADVERWKSRLASRSSLVNVGLAWAGRSVHKNDRSRSINLSAFAPLGQVPGIKFISLQKGVASSQAHTPPAGLQILECTNELTDFADTAALIANLDLVIAVDTAIVHLAGAMGKPVWTLLPIVADWRWLQARDDSPWYPSMRLFRQTTAGNWTDVIERIVHAIIARQSAQPET